MVRFQKTEKYIHYTGKSFRVIWNLEGVDSSSWIFSYLEGEASGAHLEGEASGVNMVAKKKKGKRPSHGQRRQPKKKQTNPGIKEGKYPKPISNMCMCHVNNWNCSLALLCGLLGPLTALPFGYVW